MNDKKNKNPDIENNPLSMDNLMNKIGKLLEDKKFESPEDREKFIRENVIGKSVDSINVQETPEMKAWNKIEKAYNSPPEEGEKLAKEALEIYPNCADAYNYLANISEDINQEKEYYQKAIEVAKDELGEEFEELKGHFWGLTETRPFMRAKLGYAQILEYQYKIDEAIKIYQELLELNPNDNQCVRYLLMPLLLETNRLKEYKKLYDQYNEISTQFLYNQVLYNYKKYGGVKKTTQILRKAIQENPHVIPLLIGEKKMPEYLPDGYRIGEESEAVVYVNESVEAWLSNQKALDWLYSFWQRYKNSN